jgi:succinoglycan biosynthesis protein ExoA
VSVIIPVRNERDRLPRLLALVEAQTLWAGGEPDQVVVMDGDSTDGTRGYLEQARARRRWLTVVDNPDRIVPCALNRGLAAATGELVARMDAHADYAPDYLAALVRRLGEQPEVVGAGGAMSTAGSGRWGGAIAATLRRRIGLGGARHRVGGAGGPIPHVFTGVYRASALRAVGGWDETMAANEDFEADTRLRAAGGELWLVPDAQSVWFVRESLPALAEQMWRYGFYKARTLLLHPGSLRLRQLAPPALVLGLPLAVLARPRLGTVLVGGYLGLAAGAGAAAASQDGASVWRGALVPPVVHVCWGAGLLAGLARFAVSRPHRWTG